MNSLRGYYRKCSALKLREPKLNKSHFVANRMFGDFQHDTFGMQAALPDDLFEDVAVICSNCQQVMSIDVQVQIAVHVLCEKIQRVQRAHEAVEINDFGGIL